LQNESHCYQKQFFFLFSYCILRLKTIKSKSLPKVLLMSFVNFPRFSILKRFCKIYIYDYEVDFSYYCFIFCWGKIYGVVQKLSYALRNDILSYNKLLHCVARRVWKWGKFALRNIWMVPIWYFSLDWKILSWNYWSWMMSLLFVIYWTFCNKMPSWTFVSSNNYRYIEFTNKIKNIFMVLNFFN
jgi:hypothetical protein